MDGLTRTINLVKNTVDYIDANVKDIAFRVCMAAVILTVIMCGILVFLEHVVENLAIMLIISAFLYVLVHRYAERNPVRDEEDGGDTVVHVSEIQVETGSDNGCVEQPVQLKEKKSSRKNRSVDSSPASVSVVELEPEPEPDPVPSTPPVPLPPGFK